MKNIIEWNEKINVTNITDEKEFVVKHFIDSLTILDYIEDGKKTIDIGCGAGFPGIPLKLAKTNIKETLIDSVNNESVSIDSSTWEYYNFNEKSWESFNLNDAIGNFAPTILKVTTTQEGREHYDYLSIAKYTNKDFTLDPLSGYSYVLYSGSHKTPAYNPSYFKDSNGVMLEESLPSEKYNPSQIVVLKEFANGNDNISIPVLSILNRYENAVINSWDGESILLNEDNSAVLAPMAGFGKKENGSFTGALFGEI
mgnify:CR=1 FL=1